MIEKIRIAVTADHANCSKTVVHIDDPVPVLCYGSNIVADGVQSFDEEKHFWVGLELFNFVNCGIFFMKFDIKFCNKNINNLKIIYI